MIQKTLHSLKIGEKAKITCVDCTNSTLRHRLQCLGLVAGKEVTVTKIAPFNGAIGVRCMGCSLALRKNEAEAVLVAA